MTAAAAGAAPLALTMGDPSGIGPDIALMAWASREAASLPPFALYADPNLMSARAASLGLAIPITVISDVGAALSLFPASLPIIAVPLAAPAAPGQPSSNNAPAIVAAIDAAVADVAAGRTVAVVTNPIAKSVLYAAGFKYPGHTEYLGALADRHWQSAPHVAVMMLVANANELTLRVVPLTIHVPLREVPALITRELIAATAQTPATALARDFGITRPRIAIAGLNPHAGEDGAIGVEDRDVIAPAIAELQLRGLDVTGPHSADTMFHAAARKTYDAAIAMYHDQALIPIKTLAFDCGVNVTLGLPFVRTSPDHGTAFGIAGTGRASPQSLIAALNLAGEMAARRRAAGA